jgi:integrase
MTLKKRAGSDAWWIDVSIQGKRVRESTGTSNKQLAQAYERKRVNELYEQVKLGVVEDRPFQDAIDYFVARKRAENLRSLGDYERQLGWWCKQFDAMGATLQQIDEAKIVKAILIKAGEIVRGGEPTRPATLNRYLAALRACLNLCESAKWIARVPKVVEYDEPEGRVRWLTHDERDKLLAACPESWRAPIRLSMATGLRQANVLGLRWDWLDLGAHTLTVPGECFKNGNPFCIPLSADAMAVIEEQAGQHEEFVFVFRGKRINGISGDQWKAVLKKAGIEDLRWHDLRHTWATDMTRRGIPTQALQKLGGWKTMAMVNRYAHHDVDSLRQFVGGGPSPAPASPSQGLRLVAVGGTAAAEPVARLRHSAEKEGTQKVA